MEVHRGTALARYEASSDEVKQLASNIFKKLDKDEDGKVKVGDLVDFLEQGGYGGVEPSFFEEIGKDKHGLLDFEEVVVVIYVVIVVKKKKGGTKQGPPILSKKSEMGKRFGNQKGLGKNAVGNDTNIVIDIRSIL